MTENENLEKQIADDLSAVLKEAKSMGCKEVAYFRNVPLQNVETVVKALEEIQQYRAIGTVEELKALKEKNEPEKPLFVPTDDTCLYQEYRCPSCNEWLSDKFKPYRCKCGQKLDWQ